MLDFNVLFLIFRYGFVTFENQEDADRILKKEVSLGYELFIFIYLFNHFLYYVVFWFTF